MKIMSVVGARPNFMKIAPIIRAIKKYQQIQSVLVHTGQHYDHQMSESFFEDLGIPRPDYNLGVGSGSHSAQTAHIMLSFEKVVLKEKPVLILVVGDVNSTLACSLVAAKLHIAVAHVEAGLRSLDRAMPEEINRLVTDSISDILFTTSLDANANLMKEGHPRDRIIFVGNVMIDTLMANLEKAGKSQIVKELSLKEKQFVAVTLHRPSNVDDKTTLTDIMEALFEISKKIPVIFPVHPRTIKKIKDFIPYQKLTQMNNLRLIEPLGYIDFLRLMSQAKFVITDSGGIQEETTALGIPCLTVRENTERPITITEGTNTLVGTNREKIIKESMKILNGSGKKGRRPQYWDGKSSERIVKTLLLKRIQKIVSERKSGK